MSASENPFRRSLRMPGRKFVWNPAPKGIRFEKVPHPNSGMVAFSKKSPTSAYRVYHKGKVVGIVCQVSDRNEHTMHSGRIIYRVTHVIRWLPIAPGRTYYTASELNKDTRGEAAARLCEIAELEANTGGVRGPARIRFRSLFRIGKVLK